jgi:cytochrome c
VALLAKANAENGKAIFGKCKACHNVEKGKPKLIGPNLWGIVDRPKASADGFEYSPALKAKGGSWTFADLAAFVTKPAAFAAGTKMVFTGLPNATDVADLIAYLAAQADTPAALPK